MLIILLGQLGPYSQLNNNKKTHIKHKAMKRTNRLKKHDRNTYT